MNIKSSNNKIELQEYLYNNNINKESTQNLSTNVNTKISKKISFEKIGIPSFRDTIKVSNESSNNINNINNTTKASKQNLNFINYDKNSQIKTFNFNGQELFKYIVLGTSILVLKYSIYYFFENPGKLEQLVNKLINMNFQGLPMQVQLSVVLITIAFTYFMMEKMYSKCSDNSIANKVFSLVKEKLITNKNLAIFGQEIIENYSAMFNLKKDYFVKNILGELKRMIEVDGSISISKYVNLNGDGSDCEEEIEVWKWN